MILAVAAVVAGVARKRHRPDLGGTLRKKKNTRFSNLQPTSRIVDESHPFNGGVNRYTNITVSTGHGLRAGVDSDAGRHAGSGLLVLRFVLVPGEAIVGHLKLR